MNTLVIARHNEYKSWYDEVPPGWRLRVVQKGSHLPNEGREPSSFLYAMSVIRQRTGTVAFVQGDPLDHCPDLFGILQQPVEGFRWLGDVNHHTDSAGAPYHYGLPMAELHERWLGRPWPGGMVRFAAGGQFLMPASRLARYSRNVYKDLQRQACEVEEAPWVFERLWERMFGD